METSEILTKLRQIANGDYFPQKIFGVLTNNKGELQDQMEDPSYTPEIESELMAFQDHYGPKGRGKFNIDDCFGPDADEVQQRMISPDDEVRHFVDECTGIAKLFEEKMQTCATPEDYQTLIEVYKLWRDRTKLFSEGGLSDLQKDLEHIFQVGLGEAKRELDERKKSEQQTFGTSRT